MQYKLTLYSIALLSSFIMDIVIALAAWRRRPAAGSRSLFWLSLAVGQWTLAAAFDAVLVDLNHKLWFGKIAYVGIASMPPLFLVFALSFGQHGRYLTHLNFALLTIIPLITMALALLHEWPYVLVSALANDWPVYQQDTLWYLVHAIYSYACIGAGLVLLYRAAYRFPVYYLPRVIVLLLSTIVPFVANLVFVAGLTPGYDWTPIGFVVSGALLVLAVFKLQIFELVPVARTHLIEKMSDGVVVLDAHRRIIDLNPAARHFLGQSQNSVIGQPAADILDFWPELSARWRESATVRGEFVLNDRGGRVVDLRISPLHHRPRQLAGWLLVIRDVTQRKRAEQALVQQARELRARNAELDAFAHTVAHDLKNPLSTIIGISELVLMDLTGLDVPATTMTLVQEQLDMGYKVTQIIDDLLMLATVRQRDIIVHPIHMESLINAVETRMASLLAEYGIELGKPDQWPSALGYAPWIEEVWVNYIGNALKYGGCPPQVSLGAEPCGDGFIRFWVRDNGPGLSREEQDRLFVPFTRLHTSSNQEGYGLGLSIVHRIMERLGGQVGVVSQVGQGSTFYFTLPAAKEAAVQSMPVPEKAH